MEKPDMKKKRKDRKLRERQGEARWGKGKTSQGDSNFTTQLSSTENKNHKPTSSYLFWKLSKIYIIFERKKWVEENSDEEKNNTNLLRICWDNEQKISSIIYCISGAAFKLWIGWVSWFWLSKGKHRAKQSYLGYKSLFVTLKPLFPHKQAFLASIIINNSLIKINFCKIPTIENRRLNL